MVTRISIGLALALLVGCAQTEDASKPDVAVQKAPVVTALDVWRARAAKGDAKAQYDLGFIYQHGRGVPRDDAEAMKWYRLADAQGNINARRSLRFMEEERRRLAMKPPPAPPPKAFRVQLSALKSKPMAEKEAARLSRVHKSVLGKLKVAPVRADLGKRGVYYRLRAGPISNRAGAVALCRKLAARKQGCIVIKP